VKPKRGIGREGAEVTSYCQRGGETTLPCERGKGGGDRGHGREPGREEGRSVNVGKRVQKVLPSAGGSSMMSTGRLDT